MQLLAQAVEGAVRESREVDDIGLDDQKGVTSVRTGDQPATGRLYLDWFESYSSNKKKNHTRMVVVSFLVENGLLYPNKRQHQFQPW